MEYKSETKNCQNCKKDFIIEPDDFSFYEKIKVPPPTFCPECRLIRRMTWRNTRSLYKRFCGLCNKLIISMYPDNNITPVYCDDCWNNSQWDPISYGKNYNFSETFFKQLKELWEKTPRLYTFKTGTLINCDYTNYSKDNKNVYLSYSVSSSENVMYSENADFAKDSFDNFYVNKIDNCFQNINCEGNYNTHYAVKSNNCIDSMFIFDCINCQNCFLSSNLRNKKYFFKNKQLTKDEYIKSIKEYEMYKYSIFEKIKKDFDHLFESKSIHRYASIYHSENVTGDNISNSKNIKNGFNIYNSDNNSYCVRLLGAKDCYDCQGSGFGSELIYESIAATLKGFNVHFCYICLGCRDCEYSGVLKNCNNCFGCFGLTNASYCIFNKQYSKEEYFIMVDKIKKHMIDMPYKDNKDRTYNYGEFFPFDMSPFGYNESDSNAFLNISREEAFLKGYPWKEREKRDYDITIKSENLQDSILDVNDSILKETIECQNNGDQKYQCTNAYRITPEELQFYKQKNIPLPRYCPNCRHYQRLKYHNPMKLWHRSCMKEGCTNEFETSYSPDRPEIVYCEKCYQQEVY